MNKLAIALAVGAAALLGGSAANASDNTVKPKASTDATQQSTDISSRGRHYRNYRHYGYRNYRPDYGNGYYAPRPYYGGGYGQSYYGGGGYGMAVRASRSASAVAAATGKAKKPPAMRAFSYESRRFGPHVLGTCQLSSMIRPVSYPCYHREGDGMTAMILGLPGSRG